MELIPYFKAGYPCIAIETYEEKKALQECIKQAFSARTKDDKTPIYRQVFLWTVTRGLQKIKHDAKTTNGFSFLALETNDKTDLYQLLPELRDESTADEYRNSVFIFEDAHMLGIDEDPVLNRNFKDLISYFEEDIGCCLIFLGIQFKPPKEWEKKVTILEYGLPTRKELNLVLEGTLDSIASTGKTLKLENGERETIIDAARGMTSSEAANAFPFSYIKTGRIDAETVSKEKMAAIKKSGFLELIPRSTTFGDIGGIEILKEWVRKRKSAYTKAAREFGLSSPKGILLVGVPGTGKSITAKSIGHILNLPTLRLDYGAIFSSLVGESERKIRDAIALAGAVSPVVMWIDEIDKAVSGSSSELDSGVSRRVLGTLLTWMQEREEEKSVFVCATANQVEHLPPELLRKGRFDEIFAINLPHAKERAEIFKIHLEKRGRKSENFDIKELVLATTSFTGSEIEEVVKSALFSAFDEKSELETKHIVAEVEQTIPLAKSMKQDIDRLKDWIGKRARDASAKEDKSYGREIK